MKRKVNQTWSEEEDALLQEYYHTLSLDALYAIFPGRSRIEMDQRVHYLKRKNKPFKLRYDVKQNN